ncbi:MAG: ABC transporter substrate-binding protein [Victivallaceae bacterium]|nr:ABC transporter substrate-binding protein [Victivallaceae bacterium]
MNKNIYLNITMTIFMVIAIFLGVMIINALDRVRFEQEKVRDALENLQNSAIHPTPKNTLASTLSSTKGRENVANLEFFDPASTPGGRIIRVISADTGNMNYLINNESSVSDFYSICNSSLAARNYAKPEKFEPLMAESWSISEDKLSYLIKLRRGILWHDFTDPVTGKEWKNREVTAHDFKFFIDVVQNPDTNCAPLRIFMQDIEKIEVINDYEFKIIWKRRYFLSESISLGLSPLPRHLYHAYEGPFDGLKFNDDHRRNRLIVGCGPYRFLRWDKDSRVIFTRWDKYFGNKLGIRPAIENICYEIIKMPNTQFQALTSGRIDWMGLSPEQWETRADVPAFDQDKGFLTKMRYLNRNYFYIGYNLTNPLFSDRNVRLALTHLVDRERILKDIYYGLGQIVTGPFYNESPYNDQAIAPWPFDIAKAVKILNDAGWRDTDNDGILDKDGQKFQFTIMSVANHPIQTRMLPIIKEDMAKAGIDMKIQSFEWSVYVQRLEQKNFEVCTLGWRGGYESDPYQIWHSSQAELLGSSNHIGFKNAEADRLIEEIRVEFDFEKRVKLANKLHRLLHEEQPYTFLFAPDSLLAIARRYQNVHKFPLGIADDIIWTPNNQQLAIP